MADKTFTWMHSGQTGAPQINGNAGSNGQMLLALDAALINGFNPQTVLSATNTSKNVTLTYAAPHGFEERQLISISGASDTTLNGIHRIITKTDTTVVINATGVSVVTGTIVTKVAPLNWESIFGDAEPLKRAYRSKDITSTQTVLYLDMTYPDGHGYHASSPAKRAMVTVCEDMVDIGVPIGSYTDTINNRNNFINGSLFWYQAKGAYKGTAVSNNKTKNWVIIGNDRYFYFIRVWHNESSDTNSYNYSRDLSGFGDFTPYGSEDNHSCVWLGSINPDETTKIDSASQTNSISYADISREDLLIKDSNSFFIKGLGGIGSADRSVLGLGSSAKAAMASGQERRIGTPNPATNSYIGEKINIFSLGVLRSKADRLLALPHYLYNMQTDFDLKIVDNILFVFVAVSSISATNSAPIGIDMSGLYDE